MKRLLIIDPGHGGKDCGASAKGLQEKDLALDMARQLWLKAQPDFYVATTRLADFYLSLSNRVDMANAMALCVPQAVFVSLHVNSVANAPRARGHSIFYGEPSEKDERLAAQVHDSIRRAFPRLPVYNRGTIPDTFRYKSGFTVLRRTIVPSILSEFLFITNGKDREELTNPIVLERFAGAIIDGVNRYFVHYGE